MIKVVQRFSTTPEAIQHYKAWLPSLVTSEDMQPGRDGVSDAAMLDNKSGTAIALQSMIFYRTALSGCSTRFSDH